MNDSKKKKNAESATEQVKWTGAGSCVTDNQSNCELLFFSKPPAMNLFDKISFLCSN